MFYRKGFSNLSNFRMYQWEVLQCCRCYHYLLALSKIDPTKGTFREFQIFWNSYVQQHYWKAFRLFSKRTSKRTTQARSLYWSQHFISFCFYLNRSILVKFLLNSSSLFIGNTPLKNIDTDWFRKRVAIVSQEPVLFATTIAKNIAYARDATQEEVQRQIFHIKFIELSGQNTWFHLTIVNGGVLKTGK